MFSILATAPVKSTESLVNIDGSDCGWILWNNGQRELTLDGRLRSRASKTCVTKLELGHELNTELCDEYRRRLATSEIAQIILVTTCLDSFGQSDPRNLRFVSICIRLLPANLNRKLDVTPLMVEQYVNLNSGDGLDVTAISTTRMLIIYPCESSKQPP